jgi:hypothetical protein
MSRVLPADAANTSDLACVKPAAGPCFGIRQVQNAPVTCSEPHPRASTSRKALTGSQSPASLPQSKEVKAAAALPQSKQAKRQLRCRNPESSKPSFAAAVQRSQSGSSAAAIQRVESGSCAAAVQTGKAAALLPQSRELKAQLCCRNPESSKPSSAAAVQSPTHWHPAGFAWMTA